MKKVFGKENYSKAYDELYNFFCKDNDFEHRQRSVYCSKRRMRDIDILILVEKLKKKCSWITKCLRHMDVTDVGELHEITNLIIQDD